MDFALDETLTLVRDMARGYAEGEVLPRATAMDRAGAMDPVVLEKARELGLFGLTCPEQHGGSGLGNQALAIVLEEVNRACAATGVMISVHNSLLCSPIAKWGTEEQKRRFLPELASGARIGSYCLTEPNAGSDAASLRVSARLEGDHFVLNGTKIWVTNGGHAGMFLVYARTDPATTRAKGVSALVVPRELPGISIGKAEKKCGIRASSTTEVVFENVRVPKENLLGPLHDGFPIAMDTLDGGRIGIASQAVGIARACLEAAVKYSKEREQFGKPIGEFQAIQWKLADMSTRIDAARLLVAKAAWLRDRGERCSREAAEAKLYASQTANFCADECLQIHGGAGYTDHFHVERLFRDARITEIYEGASDIQRIVIARALQNG
ncbi:MAG: acyl-CoA dehydrogenase family protein [Planctomycetia bacterium]|jgi:butyryl-CoA dehydrogenase